MKDFFVAYNVKSTYLCFVSFITQTPLTYLVEPMKMNTIFSFLMFKYLVLRLMKWATNISF